MSTKNQFLNSRLFRAEGLAPGATGPSFLASAFPFAAISSTEYRSNRLPPTLVPYYTSTGSR